MTNRHIAAAAALGVATGIGCLDPMVSDEVPPRGLVLPAGTEVPEAHEDPDIEGLIAANDGVDGEVPLLSGFAAGGPVGYWDFGTAPSFAAPLWVLVERTGEDRLVPIGHNTIAQVIPGQPRYSPYWTVCFVEVTSAYAGEIIPSLEALQEAQDLGLVLAPVPQDMVVNCPVVAGDVTLEVGDGQPALEPPSLLYWEGRAVRYYDFGVVPMKDPATVEDAPMYLLRREAGEPLSEPIRHVDMTGDGDTKDTNNIFANGPEHPDYTSLCRVVEVAVPSDYQSIDSSGDQTVADFRDASDLFDPDPVPSNVISYTNTEQRFNCPRQLAPGAR